MKAAVDLSPVLAFLPCKTPAAWVAEALRHPQLLLIDHANCEKKAAATAMSLINRHIENGPLLNKMSRLAREELRHFEQVVAVMKRRDIDYTTVTASRYASGLRALARKNDPGKLVDTLLIGALIEARSCERFAALIPVLDTELAEFYGSLLKSESRHFQDYLALAEVLAPATEIEDRLAEFKVCEQHLIESADSEFRFHSGVPSSAH